MSQLDMELLRGAYEAALRNPAAALKPLGITAESSPEVIRAVFAEAYTLSCGATGLECEHGAQRLEAAVDLFIEHGQLADFVARHCAALKIGELDAA